MTTQLTHIQVGQCEVLKCYREKYSGFHIPIKSGWILYFFSTSSLILFQGKELFEKRKHKRF